jgi:DNA repair protein RecO (recombination protein O)
MVAHFDVSGVCLKLRICARAVKNENKEAATPIARFFALSGQGEVRMMCREPLFMYRTITTNAIVLRRGRFGEIHKGLSLLTEELGLISATAYGAFKMTSRLRLGSEPFTWLRVQLYHDPVKKSYKVTEADIQSSFVGLQRDLGRLSAASLWVEVTQKSYGAGDFTGSLYHLFLECLKLLETADQNGTAYMTILFLWRFLSLAGYQPDTTHCERCTAALAAPKTGYYSTHSHSLTCAACANETGIALPAGALRYLVATDHLPLAQAAEVRLESAALTALRRGMIGMVESVLEGSLSSLQWTEAGR